MLREGDEGEEVKEEPEQGLRDHFRAAGWKVTDGKPIKVKRFARAMKADSVVSICPLGAKSEWTPVGASEITVNSAAEESVCPKSWGEAFPMRRPPRWPRFVNASGVP